MFRPIRKKKNEISPEQTIARFTKAVERFANMI